MRVKYYQTKPDEIKAVKLEADNIEQVAAWCDGKITYYYDDNLPDEIHVNGYLAKTGRHWIILQNNQFRVVSNGKFDLTYDPTPEQEDQAESDVVFDAIVIGLEELKLKFRNWGQSARTTDQTLDEMFGEK